MLVGIQSEILKLQSLGLLEGLLIDKSTKANIIWGTDAYKDKGKPYERDQEITLKLITGANSGIIKNRAQKELEQQSERTKQHAEVFTPLWICRMMNDHADAGWFMSDDPHPFRSEQPLLFQTGKKWHYYVDARRLEITCGEAPFLVSRYDASTGEGIPIAHRIGILDRKLRVVSENAADEAEWLTWTQRAFEATYGYEFQGDNLLIARLNLLMTFEEYLEARWNRKPSMKEYRTIANIIAWNIWQMDGLTGRIPYCKAEEENHQIDIFDLLGFTTAAEPKAKQPACRIYDWRSNNSREFNNVNKGGTKMKFDFIIGNPPYQEERQGTSTTALPIYHKFMECSYKLGAVTELITPARFLFNAGRTPKDWNRKMLSDPHLKALMYEDNASLIFPNTEIKGGVVITIHDENKHFGAIEIFTTYNEVNSIIHKIIPHIEGNGAFSELMFVASKFNTTNLFASHPKYIGHERRMSSNVLEFDCFKDEYKNGDIAIYGVINSRRTKRYINHSFVDTTDVNISKYKIVTPKADGNGKFGEVLANPEVIEPNIGFTHTFLGIGGFENKIAADNALKYIKTKFTRALLSVLKVTQDMNADKWQYVPLQDFTSASDIDWTGSIADIDRQLYAKYALDEKEIAFIESHVKEMA